MAKAEKKFGERLAEARKKRGLTQIEASAKAEITQGHWSEIENGKTDPTLSVAVRLAAAVGVKLGKLVD